MRLTCNLTKQQPRHLIKIKSVFMNPIIKPVIDQTAAFYFPTITASVILFREQVAFHILGKGNELLTAQTIYSDIHLESKANINAL